MNSEDLFVAENVQSCLRGMDTHEKSGNSWL